MPLEPSSHPIWMKRAKQLVSIVDGPVETAVLLTQARKTFRWAINVANNTLAFSDGRFLYFANGKWHRYTYPVHLGDEEVIEERPTKRHNKGGQTERSPRKGKHEPTTSLGNGRTRNPP